MLGGATILALWFALIEKHFIFVLFWFLYIIYLPFFKFLIAPENLQTKSDSAVFSIVVKWLTVFIFCIVASFFLIPADNATFLGAGLFLLLTFIAQSALTGAMSIVVIFLKRKETSNERPD